MSEKKQPVDLGLLEEDDEFEEFPAEDWTGLDEDEDAHVWEDNWDDDNVEDDFSNQLRSFWTLPDAEHLGSPEQQKDAPSQLFQGGSCRVQPELLLQLPLHHQERSSSPSGDRDQGQVHGIASIPTTSKSPAVPGDSGAQDVCPEETIVLRLTMTPPGINLQEENCIICAKAETPSWTDVFSLTYILISQ
ncbi:hypothetical protein TURU_103400 [Turdus rufiventris]|nr:hypothetical protein TURU_103400 [Turdus rufiventris]